MRRRIRNFDIIKVILTNSVEGKSIYKLDQQNAEKYAFPGAHTDTDGEGAEHCAQGHVLEKVRSSSSYEGSALAVLGVVV